MASKTPDGADALRAIDKVLLDQPDKVGHDFSAAEHEIAAFRDALVRVWRESRREADREKVAQVNSVLSVVLGGHFPLGSVPWPHIRKAREKLAELVG